MLTENPMPHARLKSSAFPALDFRAAEGFALLEALIAVLIFSLGVLGLIGFQAVSIQQSADARQRAEATFIANTFEGDLWGKNASVINSCNGKTITAVTSTPCVSTWNTRIGTLPDGQVVITVDSTNTDKVTFELSWKLPGESSSSARHKYVHVAEINRNN